MHIDDIDREHAVLSVPVEPELHLREIVDQRFCVEHAAHRKTEAGVCLLDARIFERALMPVKIRGAHCSKLIGREEIGIAAPCFVRLIAVFNRTQQPHADLCLLRIGDIERRERDILVASVARRDLIEHLRMLGVACGIGRVGTGRHRNLCRVLAGDHLRCALNTGNNRDILRLHRGIVAVHIAPCALRELHLAAVIEHPAQIVIFADIARRHDRGHRVVDKRIEADALPGGEIHFRGRGRLCSVTRLLLRSQLRGEIAVNRKLRDTAVSAGRHKAQIAGRAGRFDLHAAPGVVAVSREIRKGHPVEGTAVIDSPVLHAVRVEKADARDDIIRAEVDEAEVIAEFRLPVRLPVDIARCRLPERAVYLRIVKRRRHLVLIVKEHRCGIEIIRADIHQIFVHDAEFRRIKQAALRRRNGHRQREICRRKKQCRHCRGYACFHRDPSCSVKKLH